MNNTNNPQRTESPMQNARRMGFVTLKAGCLTFLLAGTALAVGFLLDVRQGIFPRWTLILLAASLPLTMGAVYLMVRRTLKRSHRPEVDRIIDAEAKPIDDSGTQPGELEE